MHSRLPGVDDVDEGWLQASTANQEPVDIRLCSQVTAVLVRNTSTVQDPRLLSSLSGDLLLQPVADSRVDLLCLLGGSDFAGTDGPNTG